MSGNKPSVEVTSSWDSDSQKCLKNAVSLVPLSAKNSNEDGALTDMVQLDSCLLLTHPNEQNGNQINNTEPCAVTLRLHGNPTLFIHSIVVVCEARVVEVFGACNEYLSTQTAVLLDEVDEMAVYVTQIELSQVTRECTLKFARLRKASEMWMYGMKVIWSFQDNQRERVSQTSSVNFEMVEQRLRESHRPLSNRAESCKQFLKMYSSLNEGGMPMPLGGLSDSLALLSLLPASQRKGIKSNRSLLTSVTQSLESTASEESPHKSSSSPEEIHDGKKTERTCCERCTEHIERVLDVRLSSMENRIMKALDDKMSTLMQHQERQMEVLMSRIIASSGSLGVRSKQQVSCNTSRAETLKDSKFVSALRQMIEEKDINLESNEQSSGRNKVDDSKENQMLSAIMALQFNDLYSEKANQRGLDDQNIPTVVKNGS